MSTVQLEEVFTSAGVNQKSHCLSVCRKSEHIVYASDSQLILEIFPESSLDHGRITSVSDRAHKGSITVVKRVKDPGLYDVDFFLSGDMLGRVVAWHVHNSLKTEITAVASLSCSTDSIGSVCGTITCDAAIVAASWAGQSCGLRVSWLNHSSSEWSLDHSVEIIDLKTAFVLSTDIQVMGNGGVLLAVGTSKCFIELYSLEKQDIYKVMSLAGHSDWIHSLSFNELNSRLLLASAGQDNYVKLWRIEPDLYCADEGKLSVTKNKFKIAGPNGALSMTIGIEAVLAGHEDWVHSTEWDLNGRMLVTSSSDKTTIIWQETLEGQLWNDTVRLGIVGGQSAGFYSASFSNDGKRIVASSYFGGLHAWISTDIDNFIWNPMSMCGGHVGEVRDVCWDPRGNYLVSLGKDQTTRVYAHVSKTDSFAEIARPQVHGHDMQCVAIISSSCFVSGAEEKILRAFQAPVAFASTLCSISNLTTDRAFGSCPLMEFGARVPALGLSNKAIGQCDVNKQENYDGNEFKAIPQIFNNPPTEDCLQQDTLWPEIQKLYGHGFEIYAVAVNPSGTVLASACKASQADHAVIMFWDTSDWSQKSRVIGHQLTVTQIEWSPDGYRLLSVSRDRSAILYRETDNNINGFLYEKMWESSKDHSRIIWACSWFSDSTHFVTASRDMKIIVWECTKSSASPTYSFKFSQPVTAVAVGKGTLSTSVIAAGLQDSSIHLLLVGGDNLRCVESVRTSEVKIDSPVKRLRFHPEFDGDKQLLASAGSDGKTRIYKIRKSELF